MIYDKIVDKLKAKFDAAVKKAVPNFDPNFFSTRRQLISPSGSYTFDRPYQQSVWIYAANKKISQSVSQSPYEFYTEDEEGQRRILPDDHELNQLFDNPNPFMSRQELIYATINFLGIDGDAMWVLDRGDATGMDITTFPENIWVFRGYNFRPEIDTQTGLLRFWRFAGKPEILAPQNVIHFQYFNPDEYFNGLAPWQAAYLSSEQDYYASNYNTNFFKQGAGIGGFIEVEEALGDEEYNRLLAQIEDRHQGHTKSHRLMLLEGGAKFQEAKLTQKDMEFIETKKITKSEILSAYGTNPVVLGDFNDVKSEAGVRAILKDFWTSVVIPNQDYIENKFYTDFLFYYNSDIRMFFNNANVEILQEDLDTLLERALKFQELGYYTNQINKRLRLHMPMLEEGNVSYVRTSLKTVAESVAEGQQVIIEEDIKVEEDKSIEQSNKEFIESTRKILIDYQEKQESRNSQINSIEITQKRKEKEFLKITKRYFKGQEKRVLDNLDEVPEIFLISESGKVLNNKAIIDDLFNDEEEITQLLLTFDPIWEGAYQEGFEDVMNRLNLNIAFDALSPDFLQFQDFKVRNIAPSIYNTVKSGVNEALQEGLANKETIAQIAKRIQKVYDIADNRALTIARTESTSSLNAGRLAAYQHEESLVDEIMWITARDEAVRSSHVLLDGQKTKPGDTFTRKDGSSTKLRFPGDMQAPAEEVINCRCVIVEYFPELEND